MILNAQDDLLIIFVKNPVKGKVKTRLAADLGESKALMVYHSLLRITRSVVNSMNVTKQVWYSDFIDPSDDWDPKFFYKKLQIGISLGERMKTAFYCGFHDNFKRIVIIGSDCPSISENHLKQAYRELADNDVVLGPSSDGGYYLLGMNQFIPELFDNKSWSTENLYAETLRTIRDMNKSFGELEILNDIDTLEDFNKSHLEI
ncbi:MAG: TIGR04282 family arsenosugar biosynthesis glycosyltransferase [Balneolaceae bacterium]